MPNAPTVPPRPSLSPDQDRYVHKASFGAFALGMIYCFANGLIKEGFLMFIPFYNIYLYVKMIFRGRRLGWERGYWPSFEAFKHRQKILDRIGIIFFAAAVFLGLLSGVGVWYATKDAADTAKNIVNELAHGRIDDAYRRATPYLQSDISKVELQDLVKTRPEFKDFESVSITSTDVRSEGGLTTATMKGTIRTKSGAKHPIEIDLEKTNGKWRWRGFGLAE